MSPAVPQVSVTKRPPLAEFDLRQRTGIPQQLREFYAAQGKHLRLGSAHPDMQAQDDELGFRAVQAEDLDKEVLKVAKSRFRQTPEGTFMRGDAILQWRTLEDRETQRYYERARLEAMEDVEGGYAPGADPETGHPVPVSVPPGNPTIAESILNPRRAAEHNIVASDYTDYAKSLLEEQRLATDQPAEE